MHCSIDPRLDKSTEQQPLRSLPRESQSLFSMPGGVNGRVVREPAFGRSAVLIVRHRIPRPFDWRQTDMNKFLWGFAAAWGFAVFYFVVTVLTIETSIPIASLAAVENSFVSVYLVVFLVLAFVVWLAPVLTLRALWRWFVKRRFR